MEAILVVDDEDSIIYLVQRYLEREGFAVTTARSGPEALDCIQHAPYALLVLDIMLSGIDGFELTRQIRSTSEVPILLLTAKTSEPDKVLGFGLGADDYLTKPFSPRELVMRIRALLRRSRHHAPDTLFETRVGDLVIDWDGMVVTNRGTVVSLTPIEFQLLKTLAERPGQVFTKQQLLDQCWGYQFSGDDRLVVVHMSNLRQKIEEDPAKPQYITTVRGVGYSFRKGP